MVKVACFDSKEYDIASFEKHKKDGMEIKFFEPKLSIDTVGLANGYDAVIVFVNDVLNEEVIEKLKPYGIKAIFLRCAGFNNVDLSACYKNRIHVFRVPSYSPFAVAEHAFALIQTSNRRIHKAYNRVKEYNFSLANLTGMDLHGKTVGVVGTGKIGKCFIEIAKGYGMNVLAYDKYPSPLDGVKYVEFEELLRESDIISLHCPLTEENTYMINETTIGKMKKGVMIVNTSRGALIDAEALLNAIKSKHVGSACLDVYEEESDIFFEDKSNHILSDDILLQLIAMPNVLITSHQAFLTKEALDNIAETTFSNIDNFFKGEYAKDGQTEVCYKCPNINNCKKKRKQSCF